MLPIITSFANQRIKTAVSLRESRKRRQKGAFLIDGVREIARAQKSGIVLQEVYLAVSGNKRLFLEGPRYHEEHLSILDDFEKKKIPVWPVAEDVFEKLAFGERNEGIVAVAGEPERTISLLEKVLPENPLLGVLEGIEKPGNIGAVFRSADGAGLDGIILADCGFDLYHPNTIRSSLGTVFRIPSVSIPADEAVQWLRGRGVRIVSAICGAAVPYSEVDYRKPTAIVLGSEAAGLTNIWSNVKKTGPDAVGISLPMRGIADSLNISNAAAILFYHALFQRGLSQRGNEVVSQEGNLDSAS